jgi:hypothetical protein
MNLELLLQEDDECENIADDVLEMVRAIEYLDISPADVMLCGERVRISTRYSIKE